jgi:hypothetical protein
MLIVLLIARGNNKVRLKILKPMCYRLITIIDNNLGKENTRITTSLLDCKIDSTLKPCLYTKKLYRPCIYYRKQDYTRPLPRSVLLKEALSTPS